MSEYLILIQGDGDRWSATTDAEPAEIDAAHAEFWKVQPLVDHRGR